VHSLFGIIVGFESTSHTFFHILRWARRNNDIEVSAPRGTIINAGVPLFLLPSSNLKLNSVNSFCGQAKQASLV
jgi:hypothetical protein